MAPHVYSQLTPPPQTEEYNSGVQLAVPDLSLSVPEIIRMALDGNTNFPMYIEDDDGQVFDLSKSDLTDRFPNADFGFDEDYNEIEESNKPPLQSSAPAAPATEQEQSSTQAPA